MPPKRTTKAPIKPTSTRKTGIVATTKKPTTVPANKKAVQSKNAAAKVVKKGPSPQEKAAIVIQKYIRGYLSKLVLKKLKSKKAEYDKSIEEIQREAFVVMVKRQQEEAEKQLEREEEERRRKRQEIVRRRRMLEAAFEGDIQEMEAVLKEVDSLDTQNNVPTDDIGQITRKMHQMAVVEGRDSNENTPLSEAAGGGDVDSITFLILRGADPNTIGAWGRTPLYRAAFGGHLAAVQSLLQYGADPRIYAQDANTPENVASIPEIVETLRNWDIAITESMLEKMGEERQRRERESLKKKEAETNELQGELDETTKEYSARQKMLQSAFTELEKALHVHDTAVMEGFEKTEVTLSAVHQAEADLEIAKINSMKAKENLEQARLKLREKEQEGQAEDELPGIRCNIRELDEVLMRDVGCRIKESGTWPLLIDPVGQSGLFLKYRDTNYLCAFNASDMKPDTLRLSLLGAIRFGKPLVIDMLDIDMFETVSDLFDQVMPDLMSQIMDKSLLLEERYMKLVQPSDHADYQGSNFQHHRINSFNLIILTKNKFPSDALLAKTYPIRIVLPAT